VRWGSPTGLTLQEIERKLKQGEKGGKWFYDRTLDHYFAAEEWDVDPDRWDELSDEAKGIIVGLYRTKRTMLAWERNLVSGTKFMTE
jgi:hypothetical protein